MKVQQQRNLMGGALIARVALITGLIFFGGTAMSLEQPEYTVVHTEGDIEYRQYDSYLVSETIIENAGSYEDAGNEGFRQGRTQSRRRTAARGNLNGTLYLEYCRSSCPARQSHHQAR